jgi:6-phosphofructokinase 1
VEATVQAHGFCAITVSEGAQDDEGHFLSEAGGKDAFGHTQLGGAGVFVQELVKSELSFKTHGAVLDYCQRSGRHIASAVDVEQAIACGAHAVKLAEQGLSGQMVTLQRDSDAPYRWSVGHTETGNIANQEKLLPSEYIREDGFHITEGFRRYCLPLIQGEDYPPYADGLPAYRRLKRTLLLAKLPPRKTGK